MLSTALSRVVSTLRFDLGTLRAKDDPLRDKAAWLAMVPLGLLLLAVLIACPWYSNFGVDSLTFFEQIRSVAHNGSIGFDNGPVAAYAELRTRWFVHAGGQAWGILPATISYLLAPFMKLGGYRATLRAVWVLFGFSAIATYALVYRLSRKPAWAVLSAYALVIATSLAFWGNQLAPFMPAASFGVIAIYFGQRSHEKNSLTVQGFYAAVCGLFASWAFGTHLGWSVAWAFLGLVCLLFGHPLQRLVRAVAFGLASLPSLLLMSWVNHLRFQTWNPVSYGPCDSHSCTGTSNNQTAGAFAAILGPVWPYILAWVIGMILVRKSQRATTTLALVGMLAALLPDTAIRNKLTLLLRTFWGFVFDVGHLEIGFPHPSDGTGSILNGRCVRALLQCSPFLFAAPLALVSPDANTEENPTKPTMTMLFGVCGSIIGVLLLRAETGGPHVWGYPEVNQRYISLLIPCAVVLAFTALSQLPLRVWHLGVLVVCAWWLDVRIESAPSDLDVARRALTHRPPLYLGFGLFVAVASSRWGLRSSRETQWMREFAPLLAMTTLAFGFATTWGIDRIATREIRSFQTGRTLELARCTTPKFILLGGYAMDEALALHDEREILFINLGMGPRDGSNARLLIDRFEAPDRPAFIIQDTPAGNWQMYWPGFSVRPIPNCPRVRRVVRVPPGQELLDTL